VYDQVLTPVLELPGELKYFPCEGVVAVGEVKSSINSRRSPLAPRFLIPEQEEIGDGVDHVEPHPQVYR